MRTGGEFYRLVACREGDIEPRQKGVNICGESIGRQIGESRELRTIITGSSQGEWHFECEILFFHSQQIDVL